MDTNTTNNMGKVVQIMGPVIDVEFKDSELPPIYTALKLTNKLLNDEEWNLVGSGRHRATWLSTCVRCPV